jgi:hypothetical protein
VAATSVSTSVPDLSFSSSFASSFDTPVKPSPDRYRRGARRGDSSNSPNTGSSTPVQAPQMPNPLIVAPGSRLANVPPFTTANPDNRPHHNRANSADDMQIGRQGAQAASDAAKRYRRRSLGGFEANALAYQASATGTTQKPVTGSASPKRPSTQETRSQNSSRPGSSHDHHSSSASIASNGAHSRPSSVSLHPDHVRCRPANIHVVSERICGFSYIHQRLGSPVRRPSQLGEFVARPG